MPQYKAPLNEMRFVMNEVLDFPEHYQQLPSGADATPDMVDAIVTELAKLCENTLAPLYHSGDREGCKRQSDGSVTTPSGYPDAYAEYRDGGWQSLSHPREYGGQGLPMSLSLIKQEMLGTANWPFAMYPGLSLGAMNTLMLHGTDEQKRSFLTPLCEGRWMGTMCLTESQCGTDLGQIKSKAVPNDDGSYSITGTKIFISSGEHDLTDNIVHIALARLPDAPEGTKGISLFIIPKFLPTREGGLGERNAVHCASLEEKMGIKASATCEIHFSGATGYLLGPANEGLSCMFTFMNSARIGTAIQGLAHAELAFQGALPYAKERRSMRALRGKQDAGDAADALIHHGDVRRMLLTQKAFAEGGRAMLYGTAQIADFMVAGVLEGDDRKREHWDAYLGFLTPILKGFLTEIGQECASLGIQVHGGHGYIKEQGMEQILRDARIATLYEGTTGIQALDLLGRKVLLMTRGKCVRDYTVRMANFARGYLTHTNLRPHALTLLKLSAQWNYLTMRIALFARKDREMVSTASYDYMMYCGYVMMAYYWAMMAAKADEKLAEGTGAMPEAFYRAKLQTAEFYFDRILPRARAHADTMLNPSRVAVQLAPEHFSFDYE